MGIYFGQTHLSFTGTSTVAAQCVCVPFAKLDKVGRSDKLRHYTAVPTSFVVTQEKELLLQQSLLECTWHVASSQFGPPVLNIFSWLAVLQPVAPQQWGGNIT